MHKKAQELHQSLCDLILQERLLDAFGKLRELIAMSEKQHFFPQLETLETNYQNILHYSAKGVQDPEQNKILNYVLRSTLTLADTVKETLLMHKSDHFIYQLKWSIERASTSETDYAEKRMNSLSSDPQLNAILDQPQEEESPDNRAKAMEDLFRFYWLKDVLADKDQTLISELITSPIVPWHDKSQIVSALTLSLFRNFTITKVQLLSKFIQEKQTQVWERALVGLILGLYQYHNRLYLYPEVKEELATLKRTALTDEVLEALFLQIIKAQDTERLTKKWEEEILPEVLKMQSTVEKKLDLENILQDNFMEDKNPDWEQVFGDSPELLDKLQQFSEMQLEGSDVFMGTFSRLKHFPFFNELSNWFVPFYPDHPEVKELFGQEEGTFNLGVLFEKLGETRFMCNSDKYSFCLNIKNIPTSHKNQMMHMFQAEMDQMKEISSEEDTLDPISRTKSIITQYIQDLYRFFKLSPRKQEFEDIFSQSLDIVSTEFYKQLAEAPGRLKKKVAEFYFEKERFPEAIELFKEFEAEVTENSELFEKIAYAFQRQGKYSQALTYYKKAELLDPQKAWITKKIALCYRYIGEHEKALGYYKEAEKLAPDDLYVQAFIGHTLFHLKRNEEALKYYFKVEYLAPSNQKIQRPIAYISLLLGKFDTAENYFKKLLEQEDTPLDKLHLGHVYLCNNEYDKALETYIEGAREFRNMTHFRSAFEEDREVLRQHQLENRDINLLLDIIQSKIAIL
ncbi:MAG: tetratricopeptide repeat protein [Bacteroidales bacterium]|jgi:tetratricopeptide (TPR) repeat protein